MRRVQEQTQKDLREAIFLLATVWMWLDATFDSDVVRRVETILRKYEGYTKETPDADRDSA
jgi:hypothetical protein